MTREMLIFAAGAVGITKKPWRTVWDQVHGGAYWDSQVRVDDRATIWVAEDHPGFPKPDSKGECMHHMPGGGYGWEWNPWYFDDDAMRLAIALGMTVDINRKVGQVTVYYRIADDTPRSLLIENSEGDLAACTRHAITRAAAFIGQHLNGQRVVVSLDVPYTSQAPGDEDSDAYKGMVPVSRCKLEAEKEALSCEVSRLKQMLDSRAPYFVDSQE